MDYELLEHPADLRIRVHGECFTELLKNAGYALGDMVLPADRTVNEIREISVEGDSKEQILVRFLNELIYIVQTEFVIFRQFDIDEKDNGINAICKGFRIGQNDSPEYDIKGATYHNLEIKHSDGTYTAEIIIDI